MAMACNNNMRVMACRHKPMLIHMATVRQHILLLAMVNLLMVLMERDMLECMASKFSTSNRHNINSK